MRDEMILPVTEKKMIKKKKKWQNLGTSIVVYNHDLNEANIGTLSPLEQNAFFYACAKVRDMEGTDIHISFDEYKRNTLFPMRKSDRDLIASFDKVSTALKFFEFRNQLQSYGFEKGSIFTYFKADAEKRMFTLRVNDEYKYLFNNLEETGFYTRFNYKSFIQVNNKHAKTLFRLLCQWKTKGKTPRYKLDYIKFLTGTENYRDRDVRTKVLDSAIKECSAFFRDLKILYSEDGNEVYFTFSRTYETPVLK